MNDLVLFLGVPALIGASIGYGYAKISASNCMNTALAAELNKMRNDIHDTVNAAINNNINIKRDIISSVNEIKLAVDEIKFALDNVNFDDISINLNNVGVQIDREIPRIKSQIDKVIEYGEENYNTIYNRIDSATDEIKEDNAETKQLISNNIYRTRNVLAERIYKKDVA